MRESVPNSDVSEIAKMVKEKFIDVLIQILKKSRKWRNGERSRSRANMQPIENTVWFAKMKSTLKVLRVTKEIEQRYILSTGFCGIKPNEKISARYLEQIFLSNEFNKKKDLYAKGSTQKAVNNESLKQIFINIPPLSEQQKIADILSKVDEQTQQTETIINKTEELKKGLMQRLLTKGIGHTRFKQTELGDIPEEWMIKKLSEIVKSDKPIIYGIVQAGPNVENGIPYIRSGDLNDTNIESNNLLRTSFEIAEKHKRSEVRPGDIILSLRGNIGTTRIVPKDIQRANLTQGTARISCNFDINNKFVNFILNSEIIKKRINAVTKGCTFREITLRDLRKLKIAIPKIEEQKQIASILSKVDEHIQDNKKELKHLQELKKGLMQDLLTGKVRVSV